MNAKELVTVVMSTNSTYVPYLATTIQSIVENSTNEREYEIVVLQTSVSEEDQAILSSMLKDKDNFSLRIINVSELVKNKNFFLGGKENFTAEAYYRLYIPAVLPDRKKVIYLDCDMVVLKDISELYDIDLGDNIFGSVADYVFIGRYYSGDAQQIDYWDNELQLVNAENYFCSGLVVMNLEKMREIGVNAIINLALQQEWQKHDQDVLNILGNGKTLMLEYNWDVLKSFDWVDFLPNHLKEKVSEAEKNPYINHFSSKYKPWSVAVDRFDLFWKYAKHTPYFFKMVRDLDGNRAYQCYILQKYTADKKITYTKIPNDVILSYGKEDIYLGKLSQNFTKFEQLVFKDHSLLLRGTTMLMSFDKSHKIEAYFKIDKQIYPCKILNGDFSEKKFGTPIYFGIGFECNIDCSNIREKAEIKFYVRIDNIEVLKRKFSFGKFFPLSGKFENSYYDNGKYILSSSKKSLYIEPSSKRLAKEHEKNLLNEFKALNTAQAKNVIKIRKMYKFLLKFCKKEIWLFSDRANKADDNGEAMFRYVKKHKQKNVVPYFVIDKRSPDYKRMKKYGKVVDCMSKFHKLLALKCTFNISSQADDNILYPFQNSTEFYKDLIFNKFIFLQHGVIKENMSATYNRKNQNMSIFVTAAKPEYDSIISNPQYDCDESVTKLTGLPRHDFLYHDEKNIITLMPTWRKYLFRHKKDYMGVWEPKQGFKNSEYFAFYNSLINDKRLLAALKKYNYKLQFMPHPNVQCAIDLFDKNEDVEFLPISSPYRKVFAESKLVLTDRSSAIMDFVYLRKPVLYCLFDDKEFMDGKHVYVKGYFDYEKDGFGEVAYDINTFIDNIIEYMKNDCKLKKKYEDRMDKFFAFNDKNNCKRVYEEILKLR